MHPIQPNLRPKIRPPKNPTRIRMLTTSRSRITTLLTNTNPTPISKHPRRNIHSRQLLKQQLRRIRNHNLRDLGLVLARPTLELPLAQAGDGRHQAADFADVDSECVAHVEQALFEERGSAVRDHAIALHFSESQPTISRTTFDWLAGEDLQWSARTGVDFVVDHVSQTLVVCRTQEDLCCEFLACVAVVHDLEAALLVAEVLQDLADGGDRDFGERRSVAFLASEGGDFREQALDQMRNRHSRWDGVRVNDDIWRQ